MHKFSVLMVPMYAVCCLLFAVVGDLLGEEKSTSSKVCRRLTIIPRAISWLDGVLRSKLTESSSRNSPPPSRGGISLEQRRSSHSVLEAQSAIHTRRCRQRPNMRYSAGAKSHSRTFHPGPSRYSRDWRRVCAAVSKVDPQGQAQVGCDLRCEPRRFSTCMLVYPQYGGTAGFG